MIVKSKSEGNRRSPRAVHSFNAFPNTDAL